jgi:hypothetical protein
MRYFADIWLTDGRHGLARVHVDEDADFDAFMAAPAERWTVRTGWSDWPGFQSWMLYSGCTDYERIAGDGVDEAMQQMRDQAAKPLEP